MEGGARNNQLINNIVWVLSGNAVSVAGDSQVGFQSDYNLLTVSDNPNANIGLWNGVARKTLTDWQAASSRDANSLTGAPGFVDIDGADNVLGYVTTAGGDVHGGNDDNFYVTRNSPAIDRGHTWQGVPTDIDGLPRSDDPGTVNTGTPRYIQTSPQPNFILSGTAQNWRADSGIWSLNLPFAFPLFDATYNSVFVTSNGCYSSERLTTASATLPTRRPNWHSSYESRDCGMICVQMVHPKTTSLLTTPSAV